MNRNTGSSRSLCHAPDSVITPLIIPPQLGANKINELRKERGYASLGVIVIRRSDVATLSSTFLREQLSRILDNHKELRGLIPVVTLSLDRINRINSTLGHDIGNFVICSIAQRLNNCNDKINIVARLESAEFSIVFEPVKHKQDAVNVGENSMESVHNVGVHRDGGFTLIFGVGCLTPYFSVKSMGGA